MARRDSAKRGTMVAAAEVPATTTVCSSSAVSTLSTRRSAIRGAWGLTVSSSVSRPAVAIAEGVGKACSNASTAG